MDQRWRRLHLSCWWCSAVPNLQRPIPPQIPHPDIGYIVIKACICQLRWCGRVRKGALVGRGVTSGVSEWVGWAETGGGASWPGCHRHIAQAELINNEPFIASSSMVDGSSRRVDGVTAWLDTHCPAQGVVGSRPGVQGSPHNHHHRHAHTPPGTVGHIMHAHSWSMLTLHVFMMRSPLSAVAGGTAGNPLVNTPVAYGQFGRLTAADRMSRGVRRSELVSESRVARAQSANLPRLGEPSFAYVALLACCARVILG